ncbi:ParA family protein [Chryseobacterium sp. 18068]|uniref:ParA family protein n=1 Tax=Chryseobacterium sp. 18068 TaxID=2681414 RepID=UPI00135AC216|nr:ParA family protein [Chryseobacterium sp. 18068]
MATTISIIAQKGGVGKTTVSLHLGASFASMKKKVLLVDFDSQRNLSTGIDIEKDYDYTIYNFLQDKGSFQLEAIDKYLFVLAGDKRLKDLDLKPLDLKSRLEVIDNHFKFDYIILDCPPEPITKKINLGKVALLASDYVLSPFVADMYSSDGIMELLPEITKIKQTLNPKLEFLGFFFNKVDERERKFKKYHALATQQAGKYFFKSFIRQDMAFYDAMENGETVFQFNPKGRGAEDLKKLSKEIIKKIKEYEG